VAYADVRTIVRLIASPVHSSAAPDEDVEHDLAYVVRLTCLVLLVTLGIVWRSYVPGHRIYAPAHMFGFFNALPAYTGWGMLLLNCSFLICLLVKPASRPAALGALGCALFFVVDDINRLQPYIYMYYFTLVAACFGRSLQPLRIMVSGVYFWAGFHKLNYTFFFGVFPWFIQPLHVFTSPPAPPNLLDSFFLDAIFITPLFEALIGILLLFPQWRRFATAMAFSMLVVVLYCLGPFGHNWEKDVWPWNVWLFLMEVRLFCWSADSRNGRFLLLKMRGRDRLSLLLFYIAPVLAMFTPWYSYMGFKLYSGNTTTAQIILPSDETLAKAPPFLKVISAPDHTFGFSALAEHEHVPYVLYPYAIKQSAAGLCSYLAKPSKAILRIYSAPPFYAFRSDHEDMPLCP
jgi:uncharacterized membrane protein YphA (DoxX/SURF4 family)